MISTAFAIATLFVAARAQQPGNQTAEKHPPLTISTCKMGSGCTTSQQSIVLDSNWRWVHTTSGYTNCYTGNKWDATLCPDPKTCTANCALDGADYEKTYGITTSGNSLKLSFVTEGTSANIGVRTYLMAAGSETNYQMIKLLNQEFTFDVDVSNLPCGLNGALYFSAMEADGGMSKYPTNKAGAKYGTGYCDAQCARDIKFINGEANSGNWTPSATDVNGGTGQYGTCCDEMDIWEANKISAAYTPHPCTSEGQTRCSGPECIGDGGGMCDSAGCDFNTYRMGVKEFYGEGMTVDTSKPFTVVTQFLTSDGTEAGELNEIKRFYVQNGKTIPQPSSTISGVTGDSITSEFCTAQKKEFNDRDDFTKKGGLKKMGTALGKGMVLVMSIWDDHTANMLWLDSMYPTNGSASTPGMARGTCETTSGVPKDIETGADSKATVTFSNIKWGDINSTFTSGGSTTTPGNSTTTPRNSTSTNPGSPTSSAPAGGSTGGGDAGSGSVAKWAQCGGQGYAGATACASGSTCTVVNSYYSQCL